MGSVLSVTIAIPVFNTRPSQLIAAINSALAQTYANIEIVVVDDGSTSVATAVAIASLSDVRVLRQENRGTGAAVNEGFRSGSGELLLVLGSDDMLHPQAVAQMVETLTSGGDVVAAHPRVRLFGSEKGWMRTPRTVRVSDVAVYNCLVATSLVRREQWESVGGFDEHNDCSEDWVFWALLLGSTGGRAVKASEALLFYRRTGQTQNLLNRRRERVRNARKHIADGLPYEVSRTYCAALEHMYRTEDRMSDRPRSISDVFANPLALARLGLQHRRIKRTLRVLER